MISPAYQSDSLTSDSAYEMVSFLCLQQIITFHIYSFLNILCILTVLSLLAYIGWGNVVAGNLDLLPVCCQLFVEKWEKVNVVALAVGIH